MTFDDYLEEKLKDPEFKKAWEEEGKVMRRELEFQANNIPVTLYEAPNGARYTTPLPDVETTEIETVTISILSEKEFHEKYPGTYISDPHGCIYLENGTILIDSQWNGECYMTDGIFDYYPVYKYINENETEIVGYYMN